MPIALFLLQPLPVVPACGFPIKLFSGMVPLNTTLAFPTKRCTFALLHTRLNVLWVSSVAFDRTLRDRRCGGWFLQAPLTLPWLCPYNTTAHLPATPAGNDAHSRRTPRASYTDPPARREQPILFLPVAMANRQRTYANYLYS